MLAPARVYDGAGWDDVVIVPYERRDGAVGNEKGGMIQKICQIFA